MVCSRVEISPSAVATRVVRLDTSWVMVEMFPSAVETLVLIPLTDVVSEEMLPVWLVTVELILEQPAYRVIPVRIEHTAV